MDEFGTIDLPVKGGKWFDHMTMGKSITDYDSMVVLTHFKYISLVDLEVLIKILVLKMLMEELERGWFILLKGKVSSLI